MCKRSKIENKQKRPGSAQILKTQQTNLALGRPGAGHIKILQHKFYAMQFFQAFWLDPLYFHPIKMLEKIA